MSIEGSPEELRALKQKLVGSRLSRGALLFSIETTDPETALQAVRAMGTTIRAAEKSPKGFK